MRTPRSRRLARASLILATLVSAAAPALAQPSGQVAEARRLFQEGVAAARESRWEEAHDAFRRSYQAAPRVLTLFNLAGAQRNTLRLAAARESYRRFLEQTAPGQHDEYRREAEKQLVELGRRLPSLRIAIEGRADGDLVELDGRPLELERLAEPITLDPGPHVVLVRRADRAVARRTVKLAEGAKKTITLRLPAVKAEPPPARADLVTPPSRQPEDRPRGGLLRSPWFWTAAAVVAVGAGVGAVFLFSGDPADPTAGTLGTVDVP